MNAIAVTGLHARLQWLQLIRLPGFLLPTVGFPALFFVLFDLGYAQAHPAYAGILMLSYVAFAVIGVTLFQFGVGIANERTTPWERFVRTLPAPLAARFAARIAVAVFFGLLAAIILIVVASATTHIAFTPLQWGRIALCAFAGGVTFTAFGIAIGYWCSPKAALPIANLFYLLLSFAGGLWMPPQDLPHFAQVISPYLPTRQFAELLWGAPAGFARDPLLALLAFAIFFAVLAAIGYRRDERQRYG